MFKKIKISIIFVVCLVLLTDNFVFAESKQSNVYREVSRKISVVDPTIFNNPSAKIYPGLRGGNQLVIYTPEFGERTNTNEFGSEAVVVNGIVVQVNGADTIIPANGFVVSGHGVAKKWINDNLTIGANVNVDFASKTITASVTSDSFVYNARSKINEVQNIIKENEHMRLNTDNRKSLYFINKSKEYILKAQRDDKNVQKYSSLAIIAADKALEYSIPYIDGELKGIWVRPTERTCESVNAIVKSLANAGITDIFLETYFHGTTIYPSEYLRREGVISQKPQFQGFDPLAAWINAAHYNNMRIHIWFETFYVGNEYSPNNPKHILNVHRSWQNTNKAHCNSPVPCASGSEHNGYFIDPANPEVQSYLLNLLNEIIVKYKPDGINLDYIRYPQSVASKYPGYAATNWGYTEYARSEFKQYYGIDPVDITYPSEDWTNWANYRQDKITEFVVKVQKLARQNRIMLSAVIFPDKNRCLETKMQNWTEWSRRNLVDAMTPLILTCDKQTAVALIKDIMVNTSKRTKIYPGLFVTFMGGQSNDLLRQIHENRKLRNEGFVLFDYAHFSENYINSLNASALKKVTPKLQSNGFYPENKQQNQKSRILILKK